MSNYHFVHVVVIAVYLFWVFWFFVQKGMRFALFTALILSLPYNNTIFIPVVNLSLATALLLIVAGIYLFDSRNWFALYREKRLGEILRWELFFLALLFVATGISTYASVGGTRGFFIAGGWAAMYILPVRVITNRDELMILFFTLALSIGTIAILSIMQGFSIIPPIIDASLPYRIVGVQRTELMNLLNWSYRPGLFGFISFAEYGIWSATIIVISFSLIKNKILTSRMIKLGLLFINLIVVIAGYMTGSRGVWIVTLIVVGYLIWSSFSWPKYTEVVVAIFPLVMIFGLLLFFPNTTLKLYYSLVEIRPQTLLSRMDQQVLGLGEFLKTPLLGVGTRTVDFSPFSVYGRIDIHNTFIAQLVSTGILGAIPYYALWGILIGIVAHMNIGNRRTGGWICTIAVGTFLGLLLENLVFPGYYNKTVAFYMGIFNVYYLFAGSGSKKTASKDQGLS